MLTVGTNAIRQMNIGFFQGLGIGSLMTLLSVMLSKSSHNSDKKIYEIPERIFDLTRDSYKRTNDIVEAFSKAQNIFQEFHEYETTITLNELHNKIFQYIKELNDALKIKNQQIFLDDLPQGLNGKSVVFEESKMKTVVKELLINAMKYSKKGDKIKVHFLSDSDIFEFRILNRAYKNDDGSLGIRGRNKKLIFEPFYRLSSVVEDKFIEFEELSFGLGLAITKKIIELNRGEISMDTIREDGVKRKTSVCTSVYFPIL